MIVYVGGVKGVGKSFTLDPVFSQLKDYQRAKVAEVMFKLLKKQKLIGQYDDMEKVSSSLKDKVRLQAFQEILEVTSGNLVFDGHYAISSASGYNFGIPLEVVKEFNSLILLYNIPEIVLQRRQGDVSKKRELDLVRIELDLSTEEAFARFYGRIIGEKVKIIRTDNNASFRLISYLKEVMSNGCVH